MNFLVNFDQTLYEHHARVLVKIVPIQNCHLENLNSASSEGFVYFDKIIGTISRSKDRQSFLSEMQADRHGEVCNTVWWKSCPEMAYIGIQ